MRTLVISGTISGMKMTDWPFDQQPNVAALSTRQVIEENAEILVVVHYEDDHSWAFLCGTTDKDDDGRVIGMGTALKLDSTLAQVADLPPGYTASRTLLGGAWSRKRSLV